MPVEDGLDIQSPPVSPLLAMGTGPRLNRRWMIGIGIGIGLVIGLIVFTLLCSATFFFPEKTLFLATASPATISRLLTTEQRSSLPLEWQQSLSTESRWPVVFGLAGTRNDLEAFVIGPRWSVPSSSDTRQTTHALIRQTGGLQRTEATKLNTLVYRETFFDHVFGEGLIQGWANASPLFPSSSSSNRIAFFFGQNQLTLTDTVQSFESETQLSAEPSSERRPLKTDLSLHLAALNNLNNIEGLLAELPLSPLHTTLNALREVPTSLEIGLTSSTLHSVRLTFREPLPANERAALQATLDGTGRKRVLSLPDGSVAVESFVSDEQPSSRTMNDDSTLFQWEASDNPSPSEATACGRGIWIARFSPEILRALVPVESPADAWLPKRALQVWRTQHSLLVCVES